MREKPNKQNFFIYVCAVYELCRCTAIISLPGTESIPLQTPAWFYAIPLLVIPAIICIGAIFDSDKFKKCLNLMPIIKLMSVISYIGYVIFAKKSVIQQIKFGNSSSHITSIFMMIFLIFDVIIGIEFYKIGKKNIEDREVICK
ncbi:MAG: hypothetical protein ACTTHG_02765 [Treponemataceae bacterium]